MSRMRLTMIVHSEGGDESGYQDACMQTTDLPDTMDREAAIDLMGGLMGHVNDELERIDDRRDDTAEKARGE